MELGLLAISGSLLLYKYIVKKFIYNDENSVEVDRGLKIKNISSTYNYYDNDLTNNNIANNINNFEKLYYKKQNYVTLEPAPLKSKFVDLSREYKDICTDIVTNHFLSTDECLFNFLNLICSNYYDALDQYKTLNHLDQWDIFFIYKGGNILRIISNDFIKELPNIASYILKENYQKYFMRSDCDFAIYIKETVPNYNKVYHDVILISYLLQVKIKQVLLNEPEKYFEFYKYSDEYKQSILQSYIKVINESKSLNNIENTQYYNKKFNGICFKNIHAESTDYINHDYIGRTDFGMQEKPNKDLALYPLNNDTSELYISVNETLDFTGAVEGSRGKFALVRTKVAFNLYFDNKLYNIGGELIDVSVSHKYDYKLVELYSHENINECICRYYLKYKENSIDFYSYTLTYLTHDLELILFVENIPWTDKKYVKRLNRLFYLYFVNIFTIIKNNDKRKNIIDSISTIFKLKVSNNTFHDDINNIINASDSVLQHLPQKLTFRNLLIYMKPILQNLDSSESNNLNNMFTEIIRNFDITNIIHSKLENFCDDEAYVNENNLYSNYFDSLIGGRR